MPPPATIVSAAPCRAKPGEQPEQRRAAEVDGERAGREGTGGALGDRGVEQETGQRPHAAEQGDADPGGGVHRTILVRRTVAVARWTQAKPPASVAAT